MQPTGHVAEIRASDSKTPRSMAQAKLPACLVGMLLVRPQAYRARRVSKRWSRPRSGSTYLERHGLRANGLARRR